MRKDLLLPGLDFEARNIFCIGRNYAEHARELRNEVPSEPVVFLKPTGALSWGGAPLRLPALSANVHHEVELVVAMGADPLAESGLLPRGEIGGAQPGGADLSGAKPSSAALSDEACARAIAGLAVGIDVTARDLQERAKSKGLPWTLAKGLRGFAPVSRFVPAQGVDLASLEIELRVSGALRQQGSTSQMLFSIPSLIAYLARHFGLSRGDLIFTGTPAGVGPIRSGDVLEARLSAGAQVSELKLSVEG